ncbi:MAG: helix-turn-helix domain-containing protein [Nanoarchaeota archaeon]|nr:helix-turn-helix domain-containing protein [Nanoarchaeota archaeon]
MDKEILREAGLNDKEAIIYLELLKERICNASKLAKLTKIQRTTIYLELENLMRKGLVSYVIKNSKRFYQAASPEKLIEILDTKKQKIKSILPDLKSLHHSIEPFKIEIFEGKEGIKTFYQDILNSNTKELLAFGVTGNAFETLKFEFPHFVRKYEKAGLKVRYLANKSSEKLLTGLPRYRVKIRYLPEKYSSDVTTIIYANKIAIQSLVKENLFVVLIEDERLFRGYKNYFEFMWNSCNL